MTTAQVVETSVTVNNNSPIQDYVHRDDQTFDNYYMSCYNTLSYVMLCIGKFLISWCFQLQLMVLICKDNDNLIFWTWLIFEYQKINTFYIQFKV